MERSAPKEEGEQPAKRRKGVSKYEVGPSIRVSVQELVCLSARLALDACCVVRSVQRRRERERKQGQGSFEASAVLKDPRDPRSYLTEADTRAQAVILAGLRARYGAALRIVAEEDEADEQAVGEKKKSVEEKDEEVQEERDTAEFCEATEATERLLEQLVASSGADSAHVSDLCVFVDPVDGTRELVEGRLHNVTCMIGVAHRGRAVAGVLASPFAAAAAVVAPSTSQPPTTAATRPRIVLGIVGLGGVSRGGGFVGGLCGRNDALQKKAKAGGRVLAVSADRGEGTPAALRAARQAIEEAGGDGGGGGVRLLAVGACGRKVLTVLQGEAGACLFNLKSSLWDSCATEAVLAAAGGKMTTLLGFPIEHSEEAAELGGGSSLCNRFGCLVTGPVFEESFGLSHAELCRRIAARPEVQALVSTGARISRGMGGALASDVVRWALSGQPFTVEELSQAVFGQPGRVRGYWASEQDAVRYKVWTFAFYVS